VGGGALCVWGGGAAAVELFGAGAGGFPLAGGAVAVGGGVEAAGGGVDDGGGGVVPAAAGVLAGAGAAVSACARPAKSNNAMKTSVAANNMRRPSLAEATTTGTRSFGDDRLSDGRPPPADSLPTGGSPHPGDDFRGRGVPPPPKVVFSYDWLFAYQPPLPLQPLSVAPFAFVDVFTEPLLFCETLLVLELLADALPLDTVAEDLPVFEPELLLLADPPWLPAWVSVWSPSL
jgi:hypothetical protein